MFVYFNFLNSNESFFYTLIKMIIHHLIKMTQIRNNKHNKKINMDIVSFELQYMLDGDKKKFMAITLNFDIVENRSYLYNYSEKLQYD